MQRHIIRLGIILTLACASRVAFAGSGGALGGGFVPPTKLGGGAAGTGDITDVIAGVGLTGGAATGAATLSVDTTYVQRRVSGTCLSSQKLLSINADGSANCAADNDTTYTAGSGITSLGNVIAIDPTYTQRRIGASCAAGSSIRIVNQDGTVGCQTDTTGAAANFESLDATTVTLATSTIANWDPYSGGAQTPIVFASPAAGGTTITSMVAPTTGSTKSALRTICQGALNHDKLLFVTGDGVTATANQFYINSDSNLTGRKYIRGHRQCATFVYNYSLSKWQIIDDDTLSLLSFGGSSYLNTAMAATETDLTGDVSASIWRLGPSGAPTTIRSMIQGSDGDVRIIQTYGTVTFKNNDTSSVAGQVPLVPTAAYRFYFPGVADLVCTGSYNALGVKWDAGLGGWMKLFSTCDGGGSGTVTSVTAGAGLSGGTITTTGTIAVALTPTTCSAGSHIFSIAAGGAGTCTADAAGGGTGTVTNIATTFPVTGGPVTTTGTLALSLCAANQVLKMNAGATAYACAADVDTNSGGTVTSIVASTGLSGGTITGTGTIALANTTVAPAAYTNTNLTVDAQGRITAASSGAAVVTYTQSCPAGQHVSVLTAVGGSTCTADVTPTSQATSSLTGPANNLAIAATVTELTITATGAVDLTGIAMANNQEVLVCSSEASAANIIVYHANGLSTATNQFELPGGVNWTLVPRSCFRVFKDATAQTATGRVRLAALGSNTFPSITALGDITQTAGSHYLAAGVFLRASSASLIQWGSGASTGPFDLGLARNAVNVLEINNGTAGTLASLKALAGTFTGTISGFLNAELASTSLIRWASTTTPGTTPDVGLGRNAAGIIEINTGVAGTFASLKALSGTFTGAVGVATTLNVTGNTSIEATGLLLAKGARAVQGIDSDTGTLPTCSGCTLVSATGRNTFTVNATAVTFTTTFATAYTNMPTCVISTNGTAKGYAYTKAVGSLAFSSATVAQDYDINCTGHQ